MTKAGTTEAAVDGICLNAARRLVRRIRLMKFRHFGVRGRWRTPLLQAMSACRQMSCEPAAWALAGWPSASCHGGLRGASRSRRGVNRDQRHGVQVITSRSSLVSSPRLLLQLTRVLASCALSLQQRTTSQHVLRGRFHSVKCRSANSAQQLPVTIAIPLEQPRRSAPATTIASASALL